MCPKQLSALVALCLPLVPHDAIAAPPQARLVPDNVTLPSTQEDERWIRRHRPIRNSGTIGAYGGVYLPTRDHELFDPGTTAGAPPSDLSTAAGTIGGRVGYAPLTFMGLEAEGGAAPTRTVDDARATLWHVRGNVVGQLPFWSVVPFALVGAGALGVSSGDAALGNDVDAAFHFGGGVKVNANERLQIRLDLRDVLAAEQGVADGVSHNGEILVGAAVRLGKRPEPREQPAPRPEAVREPEPIDTDGDGFFDPQDECPKVPGVAPHGCPKVDRDRDGFLDEVDACPEDPGVEPDGCPLRDRDGDGILDIDDACPTDPETRNGFEDADGCPDELPEEVRKFTGVIEGIYFDLDKSSIRPRSRPVLDAAVEVLAKYPDLKLAISGHTDSSGSHDYNMQLSAERADAVKRYLVGQGIDEDRIQTRGAGPDEPRADNMSREGRQLNRRIEFRVVEQ